MVRQCGDGLCGDGIQRLERKRRGQSRLEETCEGGQSPPRAVVLMIEPTVIIACDTPHLAGHTRQLLNTKNQDNFHEIFATKLHFRDILVTVSSVTQVHKIIYRLLPLYKCYCSCLSCPKSSCLERLPCGPAALQCKTLPGGGSRHRNMSELKWSCNTCCYALNGALLLVTFWTITELIAIFMVWCRVIWQTGTNTSNEFAASIFRVENVPVKTNMWWLSIPVLL
jgi:hypothetical protein